MPTKSLEELLKERTTIKDEIAYYSEEYSKGLISLEKRDIGQKKCYKELEEIKKKIKELNK